MGRSTTIARRSGLLKPRQPDPALPRLHLNGPLLDAADTLGGKLLPRPDPPRDQGTLPCCVSMAVIAAVEALMASSAVPERLSPLYHYFVARAESDSLSWLDIETGFNVAGISGVCAERLHAHPPTRENAALAPSAEARADAELRRFRLNHRATQVRLVMVLSDTDRRDTWRSAIAADWPIVLGFHTTEAYFSLEGGGDVLPDPEGQELGSGHAAAVLGYDDGRGFLVADSRGPDFGAGGAWWLPFEFLDRPFISQAWCLTSLQFINQQ